MADDCFIIKDTVWSLSGNLNDVFLWEDKMKKILYRGICVCGLVSIMLCACGRQKSGGDTEGETAKAAEEASKSQADQSSGQETYDLIPMVMIDGKLYMDTGYEVSAKDRDALTDGKITSEVDQSEQPKEDDQSNFGTGYEYQYGISDGLIEIHINDGWWVFATEEVLKSSAGMVEYEDTANENGVSDE